ncbi:MAG: hypothetical protein N2596_00815 [Syntrophorhabdaceae bacterium]|nr:hypothetical protein [Syntrophorhabdaceae bacterium]
MSFFINEMFDGTVNGGFCYAMEPMIYYILAWKRSDFAEARRIWNSGLSQLNDFVYGDYARLHVRYKIGAWLRGFIPEPFMRPPQPTCKAEEIGDMERLLKNLGLNVIPDIGVKKVIEKL